MSEKRGNSIEKADNEMTNKPIPGGYATFQILDAIKMATSDIRHDIEATTRVSIEPAEFYRLLAKFTLQIQKVDQSVNDLEDIFRR